MQSAVIIVPETLRSFAHMRVLYPAGGVYGNARLELSVLVNLLFWRFPQAAAGRTKCPINTNKSKVAQVNVKPLLQINSP